MFRFLIQQVLSCRLRQNLVGSIHTFEPELDIVVYDIGLHDEQRLEISSWRNSRVVTMDLTLFPPHVRNLSNYAWKACVIRHAAESLPCFLFLDAGMELRDSVADIQSKVRNHGGWFVTASNGRRYSTLAGVVHPGAHNASSLSPRCPVP